MAFYPSKKIGGGTEYFTDGEAHKLKDFGTFSLYERFFKVNVVLPSGIEVIVPLPTITGVAAYQQRIAEKSFGTHSLSSSDFIQTGVVEYKTTGDEGKWNGFYKVKVDTDGWVIRACQSMTGNSAWTLYLWIDYFLAN